MSSDGVLPTQLSEEQVRRDDRAHVFHSWSAQAQIDPMPIADAKGSYFWDYSGKKYLDFSSQLVNVNIGYQHPRLVAAIQEYAGRQCTIAPSFANDMRSEAARLLAELAPGDLNKVFFTNGGADANEHAIRMARLHTGRHKVLAAYRSYHGATAGAIMLTGDPRRSLFRIHRDIRFSADKSPYKTNAACQFFHQDAGRGAGQDAEPEAAGPALHEDDGVHPGHEEISMS